MALRKGKYSQLREDLAKLKASLPDRKPVRPKKAQPPLGKFTSVSKKYAVVGSGTSFDFDLEVSAKQFNDALDKLQESFTKANKAIMTIDVPGKKPVDIKLEGFEVEYSDDGFSKVANITISGSTVI